MRRIFKWKHSGRWQKHALEFTAPGESFAVEFVVVKHFSWESSHVEPYCVLDIVVYILKCVFCWHIQLEIEFKRRVLVGSGSL